MDSVRSVTCVVRNCWRCSSSSMLADGVEIDVAEALDLVAQLLDLGRRRRPNPCRRAGSRAAFGAQGLIFRAADRAAILPSSAARAFPGGPAASPSFSCSACRICSTSACSRAKRLRPVQPVASTDLPRLGDLRTAVIGPASDSSCCFSTSARFRGCAPIQFGLHRDAARRDGLGGFGQAFDLLRQFGLRARSAAAPAAGWRAAFPGPGRATPGQRSAARQRGVIPRQAAAASAVKHSTLFWRSA